jgi:phage shock protein E
MGIFSSLFGKKADLNEVISRGGIIVDVRSVGEFKSGHVKGAVNMPLDSLRNSLKKLDKNKPIITCCASGMRSASAKSILKSNGFQEVHNGGSWMSLRKFEK